MTPRDPCRRLGSRPWSRPQPDPPEVCPGIDIDAHAGPIRHVRHLLIALTRATVNMQLARPRMVRTNEHP